MTDLQKQYDLLVKDRRRLIKERDEARVDHQIAKKAKKEFQAVCQQRDEALAELAELKRQRDEILDDINDAVELLGNSRRYIRKSKAS